MARGVIIAGVIIAAIGHGYYQDNPHILDGIGGIDGIRDRATSILNTDNTPETGGKSVAKTVNPSGGSEGGSLIITAADDLNMNQAEALSRQYLGQFLDAFNAPGANQDDFTVKVRFPIMDQGSYAHEIIWTTDLLQLGEGHYSAALDNIPEWLDGFEIGERLEFTEEMIQDWSIVADGTIYGHFSTRALFQYMAEDEVAAMKTILSSDPIPPFFVR